MIVSFKNGEKVFTMENADMRAICGGAGVAAQTFPCKIREKDGYEHVEEVSSVEECLAAAGF